MPDTDTETKLETSAQTTPEGQPEAKPEEGRPEQAGTPSQEGQEPSQEITPEQYKAAVKAMNEAQQRAAEHERQMADLSAQAAHYRNMAQAAAGVAQTQMDPVASAEAELNRVMEEDGYNTAAVVAAQRKLFDAERQRDNQNLIQQLQQLQRVQSQMPEAQKMLGVNDEAILTERLTRVHQSLTLEDLALVDLYRQGKLNDHLSAEQKAREEAAQQAELLKSIGGSGGGRVVPGALQNTPAKRQIDWVTYRSASKSVRKAIDADPDIEIVNVPEQ